MTTSRIFAVAVLGAGLAGGLAVVEPASAADDLRTMIAGMMMVGFRGTTTAGAPDGVRAVRDLGVGGIVLFDRDLPSGGGVRNIHSPDQLRTLIADLQALSDSGLIVAVDQEGGRIARLADASGFAAQPSAETLGAGSVDETRRIYGRTAGMLADLGITLNLAPVVDVNVNPRNPIIGGLGRSFGADPADVSRHTAAAIEGHHDHGVATAAKHFPGHGSSLADSHLGFTDISQSWSRDEIIPFAAAIAAGTDAIMTAHVFHQTLDPDWPATLSPAIINQILRGELGFDGVILSDDMQMAAITGTYDLETAIRQGLLAGIDMFIFANQSVYDPATVESAIDIAVHLVEQGVTPRSGIEASHQRLAILRGR